ncbi:MAG: host attachment protein [Pseudomonadota bacterium]
MSDYCVAVIGGAQARFFTLEPVEFPQLETGPNLVERDRLLNPQKEMPGRDLYSDQKAGRSRAPRGGPSHGYDDHRSQHEDEFDRRFGRKILDKANQVARANQARCVLLIAPSRMLGLLRQDMDTLSKHGLEVHEFAKDMTKFSPRQIHDHLTREDLLPPCKKPGS